MTDTIKAKDVIEVIKKPNKVKMVSMATVVDENGTPLFHIVSTKWSRIALGVLGGLLLIIAIIAVLAYINNYRIQRLETKQDSIDVHQIESDARQTESDTRQDKSDTRQDKSDARQTQNEVNANK